MTTTITIKDKSINATYQNVTGLTGGTGTGAAFDVTKTEGVYSVVLDSLVASAGAGYVAGDIIEVLVYSQTASAQGFYEVPVNLENNPFNGNSSQFTLGTVRQHYGTICENLLDFQGTINGRNNTRDLGNIIPFGQQILQQSSPLTLAGFFIRNANYDIFGALAYNSQEYTKYKMSDV
jgi:hypothetical protein